MTEVYLEQFKAQIESLAIKINADINQHFQDKFREMKIGEIEAEMPQVPFQTIYAAVLMKIAAVLAIDSGIDKDKFITIADESFDGAYKAAPKFS